MIDLATFHRWMISLLYVAIAGIVVFVRLLPLGTGSGGLPPPDLMLLLGFAWVLRRPDFVPVWLFAAVLLVTDLLFLRPPGVGVGFAVIGLEFLRSRAILLREQTFTLEWATIGVVLVAMLLGERLLLALFVVDQVNFGLAMLSLLVNLAFYPLVVGLSVFVFRVRRLNPGEHAAEVRLV